MAKPSPAPSSSAPAEWLARPNLVALSGQKASFLAGGEFPFPVPNGRDTVSIEFREFGVKLDFEPVVQDNGLIRVQNRLIEIVDHDGLRKIRSTSQS